MYMFNLSHITAFLCLVTINRHLSLSQIHYVPLIIRDRWSKGSL